MVTRTEFRNQLWRLAREAVVEFFEPLFLVKARLYRVGRLVYRWTLQLGRGWRGWALSSAAAVAGLVMAIGLILHEKEGRPARAPAAASPVAAQPLPGAQPAPTPAGPSQEEIKAEIQYMVSASSQEMEAKMKAQYEERLKQLQQQLQEAKKRDEEQTAERAPAPVPASVPPPAETRTAAKPSEPVPTQEAAAPAPARQQVQYGDLVTPGSVPGVTPPKLASRLDPRYPAAAQRMNKSAQVDIKVLVDEKGRVLDAQRSGQQAGFGFDEAALDAARRAQFQPAATRDGIRVKMWTVIRVSFQPR